MDYAIEIQSTLKVAPPLKKAARAAAEAALKAQEVSPPAGLTVLLAGDDYLRELNAQFRQEDRATDVLSFPAGDMPADVPELQGYLGDIAVSVPYAQKQADEKGHSLADEVQLLVVHGVLHLLGYDHLEPGEKSEMWSAQATVLEALAISHVRPSEDEHDH